MTLFSIDFTYLQLALLLYIMVLGIALSAKNWAIWFINLFLGGTCNQNLTGKLLDATWIVCIIVLIGTYR